MFQRIKTLPRTRLFGIAALLVLATGIALTYGRGTGSTDAGHGEDAVSGPNGGRLLVDGEFAVELTIFEDGVPPQFRVHPTLDGVPISPELVTVSVTLDRLGGVQDRFKFAPQDGWLTSDSTVAEPHSFDVTLTADFDDKRYEWSYASYEGRTEIPAAVAAQAGVTVVEAGPATLVETVPLYGVVKPDAERVRRLSARYPGQVREVMKRAGDSVRKGETLATVESNEALQTYAIRAPIDGVVVERNANPGEAVGDGVLFTIADTSSVWVELAVFHRDLGRVKVGQQVRVGDFDGQAHEVGKVSYVSPVGSPASQSVLARAVVSNRDGHLMPGLYVTGELVVSEHAVPLTVPLDALQSFRDRPVVFEQVGDTYEVRMLTLGRRDAQRVEVLDGLAPGAKVVATNSYLVKADIEKSGASHDH
jgi:cobalt-zinc-cadmium efflux system membrane fusion protein